MLKVLVRVSLVIVFAAALPAVGFGQSTSSVSAPLPSRMGSEWKAGLVSLTYGSEFFFGATGSYQFAQHWAAGLRGGTALDFSSNQSFVSGFGRWYPMLSGHFFLEGGVTALSGLRSGSRLAGVALGTSQRISTNWMTEILAGYEGVDRLISGSPFSSWSTVRLQVGFIRNL